MQKRVIKTNLALVDDAKALQSDVNSFISDGGAKLKQITSDLQAIEKLLSSLKSDYSNLNKMKFEFLNKNAMAYNKMWDEASRISRELGIRVLDNPDFARVEKAINEGNRMADLIDNLDSKISKYTKI